MSNLRDIKKRITNVSVIEKMTQSMKAISTSRLSAAKAFRASNNSYFSTSKYVVETLLDLQRKESATEIEFIKNMFTTKEDGKYKKTLYIIITSDRGLCGSYNNNVFKSFSNNTLGLNSSEYFVLPIGKKSLQFVNKLGNDSVLDLFISSDPRQNIEEDMSNAVNYICSLVVSGEIDRIQFIYTKSQNIMLQEVLSETIFPVSLNLETQKSKDMAETITKNIVTDTKNFSDLTEELLRSYIAVNIFDKITEAAISEHASRLNAMSGAYDNSKELKRSLNLEYNRTRQGLITKELIEIISGAEAL